MLKNTQNYSKQKFPTPYRSFCSALVGKTPKRQKANLPVQQEPEVSPLEFTPVNDEDNFLTKIQNVQQEFNQQMASMEKAILSVQQMAVTFSDAIHELKSTLNDLPNLICLQTKVAFQNLHNMAPLPTPEVS